MYSYILYGSKEAIDGLFAAQRIKVASTVVVVKYIHLTCHCTCLDIIECIHVHTNPVAIVVT